MREFFRILSLLLVATHLFFACAGFFVEMDEEPLDVSFGRSGDVRVKINWRGFFEAFSKGANLSLILSGLSATLSAALGGVVGLVLGYSEKWRWSYDVLFAALLGLPAYFFVEMLVSIGYQRTATLYVLILGISLSVRSMAIVYNEVLNLKKEDFVVAAEVAGNTPFRVVFVHILPHVTRQLLISWMWAFVFSAVLELNFSYLGVGFGYEEYSWGVVLREMKRYIFNNTTPFLLFGGLISLLLSGYVIFVIVNSTEILEENPSQ